MMAGRTWQAAEFRWWVQRLAPSGLGGRAAVEAAPGTVAALGTIRAPLQGAFGHYRLEVEFGAARNGWNVWVYPEAVDLTPKVEVATTWEAARAALAAGKSVVLHSVE